MKFAHLADCHLGSWRDSKLRELSNKSFTLAINKIIENKCDFTLISGDLFDTALPSIDVLKVAVQNLRKLKDNNIRTYAIPGSHDFSPSGKTILTILEDAKLLTNVMKKQDNILQFTEDLTGAKITGIHGKKGGLDIEDYLLLNKINLEEEQGIKIFLFHNFIDEHKPQGAEYLKGIPLELFPKNFTYYAGGHIHSKFQKEIENYGTFSLPGPLFPNNFKELEELKQGYIQIITTDPINIQSIPIQIKEIKSININAEDKTIEQVKTELFQQLTNTEDKILLIRIQGTLQQGKPSELTLQEIQKTSNNHYTILRNFTKFSAKKEEFEKEIQGTAEEIENTIIYELKDKQKESFNIELFKNLLHNLDKEKQEGERNIDFETRITKIGFNILNLKNEN